MSKKSMGLSGLTIGSMSGVAITSPRWTTREPEAQLLSQAPYRRSWILRAERLSRYHADDQRECRKDCWNKPASGLRRLIAIFAADGLGQKENPHPACGGGILTRLQRRGTLP
jgi:hypothetical protein